VFRVRDFSVHDIVSYPIEFTWEKTPDIPDEDTSLTVFNKGNVLPSTKILTFYRKHAFDLEAKYAKPELLPGKTNPWIGRFSVKGVKEDAKGDFMICKLKARLNVHGILNVESGYYVEEVEVEEPIPEPPKEDGDAMDVDKKDEKPKMRKVKKQQRKGDLPLSSGTATLDEATKAADAEREQQMIMEDKLVQDTEHQKNELESFIYELKDKITSTYSEFASDDEKSRLSAKLDAIEDWLYDEGDDATKAQYISKQEDIRSIAGPIIQRYNDKIEEERQAVMKKQQEAHAAKQAEIERKKREEEAKKQEESKDTEMSDADNVKPDEVEEPSA